MQINPVVPTTADQWLSLGMYAVMAAFGAGVGTYITQKVKNVATKADIAAITEITKEIESRILNTYWSKQKTWELKQQVIFEVFKELATLNHHLLTLVSTYQHNTLTSDMSAEKLAEAKRVRADAVKAFEDQINFFWRAKGLAMISCGKEVRDQLSLIEHKALQLAAQAIGGEKNIQGTELTEDINKVGPLIQHELEI